jgi:hypothetical protein
MVGTLQGEVFTQVSKSPMFDTAAEAEVWAKSYLKSNPGAIQSDLESLTWREFEEE